MNELRTIRLKQRNGSRRAVLVPPHVWSQFAYFRLLMHDAGGTDDVTVTMSDDINCLLLFLKQRCITTIENYIVLFNVCNMLGLDDDALLRGCMNTEQVRLALEFTSTSISNALCDIFVSSLPKHAPCTDLVYILNRNAKWRILCVNMLSMNPPLDPRNLSNLFRVYREQGTTCLEKSICETIRSMCTQ